MDEKLTVELQPYARDNDHRWYLSKEQGWDGRAAAMWAGAKWATLHTPNEGAHGVRYATSRAAVLACREWIERGTIRQRGLVPW